MRRIPRIALVACLSLAHPGEVRAQYLAGTVGADMTQHAPLLACPRGSYVVGLYIVAGTYVNGLQLKCASPSGGTTLGPAFDGPEKKGRSVADMFFGLRPVTKTVFYPRNHVLAGIKAKGGTYVDRIMSIRCVRYKATAVTFLDVGMGGTGGTVSRPYCRYGGDYTHQIRVLARQWIDGFKLYCRAQ